MPAARSVSRTWGELHCTSFASLAGQGWDSRLVDRRFFGGKGEVVGVVSDVLHDVRSAGLRGLGRELGCELQSVHHDACLTVVDASFAEGIAYLGDGELDALAILDGSEFEALVRVLGAVQGFVELLVVVAVGHSPERGAVAVTSSGHDVATSFDFEHGDSPWRVPPSPHLLRVSMLLTISCGVWLVAGY